MNHVKIIDLYTLEYTLSSFEVGGEPVDEWREAGVTERAFNVQSFGFWATSHQKRFEINQQVGWGVKNLGAENLAYISASTFSTAPFRNDGEENAYYSRLMLDLGKSLYEIARPTFGWIEGKTAVVQRINDNIPTP
jgi:hypothetical protein